MCLLCDLRQTLFTRLRPDSLAASDDAPIDTPRPAAPRAGRRRVLGALGGLGAMAALPAAQAQVDVGESSSLRKLVPAATLENAAGKQYEQLLAEARQQGRLAPESDRDQRRLQTIARRLIPYTLPWNSRARAWRWQVNLIRSDDINAFCMPGGKIAFYTGILDKLALDDDEAAMVMGHEMAHALREHSRERLAKTQATSIGLSLGARLLGLGDLGDVAANLGTQLLSLKFSRSDETEADLVGLELGARAAYNPQASVTLWQKMSRAAGGRSLSFLSTHPSGPERIRELQANIPRVAGLYEQARRR